MLGFNKKLTNTELGEVLDLMPEPISEGLVKRDSYFHSCWVYMKQEHPELWDDMTRIELTISGLDPDAKEEKTEDDDEKKPGVTM